MCGWSCTAPPQSESKKITIQATGAISWRKEDIKYRKNECFIDIIESLNLIMSNKGAILRVDVSGQVMVKAFLSGMPECKFGLNDKLLMERNNANAKKRYMKKTGERGRKEGGWAGLKCVGRDGEQREPGGKSGWQMRPVPGSASVRPAPATPLCLCASVRLTS